MGGKHIIVLDYLIISWFLHRVRFSLERCKSPILFLFHGVQIRKERFQHSVFYFPHIEFGWTVGRRWDDLLTRFSGTCTLNQPRSLGNEVHNYTLHQKRSSIFPLIVVVFFFGQWKPFIKTAKMQQQTREQQNNQLQLKKVESQSRCLGWRILL